MKKRLLITSIVMMLVVAVALSTATYAWFTSNQVVSASKITMRAAVSGESSLVIGWLGGSASSSIDFDAKNGSIAPMAPVTLTVGTTTSDVAFNKASIRMESDLYKFNAPKVSYSKTSDTALAVGKTYYTLSEGVYTPVASPAVGDIGTYYERDWEPLYYNNGDVRAFYVKNLSDTNTIDTITVAAKFADFGTTPDETFVAGRKYYKFVEASVTPGNTITANTYYLAENGGYKEASGTFLEGKTYYTKTEQEFVASNPEANQIVAGTTTSADYYEELTANDMVRIALFTKAAYEAGVGSPAAAYTLLGVLAKDKTTFTQASDFDLNTTYYTIASGSGDNAVYEQVAANLAAFDGGTTYYTADYTAVFGNISENGNVKDIAHYTKVVNSMTLTTDLLKSQQVDIVAVAWFDGTELNDARASQLARVFLEFTAS